MSESKEPAGTKRFGPGLLVAAAFIGPGTVLTAAKGGASYGCDLLWAIAFSVLGAIALQLLAARLGILSGSGLGDYIRNSLASRPVLRIPAAALILVAIGFGNAAYQTGNLTGAATGLATILGGSTRLWVCVLGGLTALLLTFGNYKLLQRVLIGLVAFLSLSFLITAGLSLPDLADVASGFFPSLDIAQLSLVIGLIGTTIVPYNLFLHASSAAENWKDVDSEVALRQAKWDTVFSISLGGLVTAAILLTAASAFHAQGRELGKIGEISEQLRPVLGDFSVWAFAIGLFAAGLTSSITAPLATGYAVCGVLGWPTEVRDKRFRAITLAVVGVAIAFLLSAGEAPAQTILVAQVANGLLLPIIAVVLLVAVFANTQLARSRFQELAGVLVVAFVTCLAAWKLWHIFA